MAMRQIKAALRTFNRSSFGRLSRDLEKIATTILKDAGIPCDAAQRYIPRGSEGWTPDSVISMAGGLPLDLLVTALGHAPDSSEGYAARLLMTLAQASAKLRLGNTDDALALVFSAGALVKEVEFKCLWEHDALVGESVRAGGRKGSESAHGSGEAKQAKYAKYVSAFDQAVEKGLPIMSAYQHAARGCRVKPRTIQRAVAQRNTA
jgi:hypothetical protein